MARALVTGGAGYIGSHTCKLLAQEGFETAVFDNLSRGHRDFVKWGPLVTGDLKDAALLRETLRWFKPDVVIHFAAFAYVGESISNPGLYYDNNIHGTLSLLEAMRQSDCRNIIVSSTCATYGQPERMPIDETMTQNPINPYGESKLVMERMCRAFEISHGIRSIALRYFNACGADIDGEIGERHDPEPHLIPRVLMAADGALEAINVFGDDYPTQDGSCIRDYIHVADLAAAHVKAARHLMNGGGSDAINLGAGRGHSVFEVVAAAERATGKPVPLRIGPRRQGDPAELIADATKANRVLSWNAGNSGLDEIIQSAWSWHKKETSRASKA